MNSTIIPLPQAIPGRDYIIEHIENGETSPSSLKGYGIIPGTKIRLLFASPSGDPCAYEVLGTVIALRFSDSINISISSSIY